MAFDLNTAKRASSGFDLSSAKPINLATTEDELGNDVPRLSTDPAGAIISSGKKFAGDIFDAVAHPIQTGKALGGLALGVAEKAIPGRQEHEVNADAVGQFIKDRYGSIDAFKETLDTDPVGALADLATIATGAGAVLKGAGTVGKVSRLSQAGNVLLKTGEIADPLNAASKLVGGGVKAATKGRVIGVSPGKVDADLVNIAKELDVDLPASAISDSKATALIESQAAKGLFAPEIVKTFEKAKEKISVIADEIINKAGPTDNLSTAGEAVAKGADDFRDSFIKVKNRLYKKANIHKQGNKIIVSPDQSLPFIKEMLKTKNKASKLLGEATDIKFFRELMENFSEKTGSKEVLKTVTDRDSLGTPIQKQVKATEPVKVPAKVTASELKSAIDQLNEKLKSANDPIVTGNRGTLNKLVVLMSQDLDNAIIAQNPGLKKGIESANRFYSDGINTLNSAYGRQISKYADSGQFDKIVPGILNKNTSVDDIPKIYKLAGKEAVPAIRSSFLEQFFNGAKNAEGVFTPEGISRQIKKFGEEKIAAILTPEQLESVRKIEKLSKSLKKGEKITGGSQTAFTMRLAAEFGPIFVNPMLSLKLILGDLLFSKYITSKSGQAFLTHGVDLTNAGEKVGSTLIRKGTDIGRGGQALRTGTIIRSEGNR